MGRGTTPFLNALNGFTIATSPLLLDEEYERRSALYQKRAWRKLLKECTN